MKRITILLYEVDLDEIQALPYGFTVLQLDNDHSGNKRLLQAHIDFFSPNLKRFKYFLFEAPPLPTSLTHSATAAGVRNG